MGLKLLMNIVILCIGNIDGGDDAVGPYIAEKLKNNFTVINAGTVPENYTSIIKKHNPQKLIIIDAVDMNLDHGEIRIVPKEKIGKMTISTHGIPISVLIGYLEQYVDNISIIGIQTKVMSGKISEIVKKSADNLVKIIHDNKIDTIEKLI